MPNLTATCPTSPDHTRFTTTAHVMQEWVVDEHGNFVEASADLEVTHGPDAGNLWTCQVCGTSATVTTP